MTKIAIIAAGVLIVSTAAASAHAPRYDADARQARQAQAIEAGRQSGSITWREGRRLRRNQREIADVKSYFREDGELTGHERAVLHGMQDRASHSIAAERSDRWRRPWWLPRVGR
jgi:hypothetical protein